MNQEEMKKRTKEFAKNVMALCKHLPKTREGWIIGDQIFRSSTSVGANYRAACRARSKADFIAKLGLVLEEADESLYWLELLLETQVVIEKLVKPLIDETNELIAIMVSSLNTVKERMSVGKVSNLRM